MVVEGTGSLEGVLVILLGVNCQRHGVRELYDEQQNSAPRRATHIQPQGLPRCSSALKRCWIVAAETGAVPAKWQSRQSPGARAGAQGGAGTQPRSVPCGAGRRQPAVSPANECAWRASEAPSNSG